MAYLEGIFFIFYALGQALIFAAIYVLLVELPPQPVFILGSLEYDISVVLLITIFTSLVMFVFSKRADRPILQRICFNLSISAAKKIKAGQLVEGSLLVKELLNRINQYSELGKYKIEIFMGSNEQKATEEFFPGFEANLKELAAGTLKSFINNVRQLPRQYWKAMFQASRLQIIYIY